MKINKQNIKELFLYGIVGVCATLAEWLIFYLLDRWALHYTLATVIAYLLSTFVNWLVGRLLVFKESRTSLVRELLGIYLTAGVGLVLNLLIMWISVDLIGIGEMLSKILATAIVFFYNFIVRKLFIYK